MQQTEYKTATVTITVIESNIFENHVNKQETVTIEDIKKVKELNLELAKHTPYCILVTKGEFSIVPPKVREYISKDEFVGITVAKALLTNSIADKIIGRFYVKINKPTIKTKIFTNRNKAIYWLKQQLEKNTKIK